MSKAERWLEVRKETEGGIAQNQPTHQPPPTIRGPENSLFCVQKYTFINPNICMQFVSSDWSSYSDDVLLYIQPLFQIFTQSVDAIDVRSVTPSRLNSVNEIDVIRKQLMLIECRMFQCSNDPMFKCSNVPMIQCSYVFFFS